MMKLSTMQKLVATLDEQDGCPTAEEILACWPHDPGSARFFRASANFIFAFQNQGRKFILRFNQIDERSPERIRAELDILRTVASRGSHVACPIPSLSGHDFETVDTALGAFHAVVFDRIPGVQYEIDELPLHLFTAWGQALGELHLAAREYHGSGRPSWEDHLSQAAEVIPPEEKAARANLERLRSELQRLPAGEDNFGLIHFDFEDDNLIWQEDIPWIIDFDSCARYWYAADFAFGLRGLFEDRADRVDPSDLRYLAFVQGYRQVREISQAELDRIPLFLRWHNLYTFAGLLRSLEGKGQPDDPAWAAALRKKLNQKLDSYRQAFVDYLKSDGEGEIV